MIETPVSTTPITAIQKRIWITTGEIIFRNARKSPIVASLEGGGAWGWGWPQTSPRPRPTAPWARKPLHRQQALEERAVAPQRLPQVLGRNVPFLRPLLLEPAALLGEDRCQPLSGFVDQRVGLLHGIARLIHEPALDFVPAGLVGPGFFLAKQRGPAGLGLRGH